MNYSPNDPAYYRDKALEYAKKGKEVYSTQQDKNKQQMGYEIFKKGIQFMIQYAKMERNRDIVEKVKETLRAWLAEAKKMEAHIINEIPAQSTTSHPGMNTASGETSHRDYTTIKPTSRGYEEPRNQVEPRFISSPPKKIAQKEGDTAKLEDVITAAIVAEKPNVKWEDVAGLEGAKRALQEAVVLPIKYPHLFVGLRTPWKGILLYGPPGTGKTFLAKACASETNGTFFSVSASDLMSKWVGESEKLIKTLFKMARQKTPAIIFIDELDSLLSSRSEAENEASRRVKTEFLVQMQGIQNETTGLLVLGATNVPWMLDPAVRRRFEKRIYIPLPDVHTREALIRKQLAKTRHSLTEDYIAELVDRTEGYSCSDINILVRDAAFEPIRKAQNATHFKIIGYTLEGKPVYQPTIPTDPQAREIRMLDIPGSQLQLPPVSVNDFELALMRTKPSVSHEDLKKHEAFTNQFGIEG